MNKVKFGIRIRHYRRMLY